MPFDFAAHDAISETAQFFAHKRGLMVFNGSSWRNFSVERSVYSNTIYTLGTSRTGEVYLSGELALQKTDGLSWDSVGGSGWLDPPIRFHPNGSLWMGGIPTDPPRYVTGLDFDGYGKYWGSYGSIMKCCFPFQEWRYEEMGIPQYAQFMDVVVDRYERIWAAGWYYGGVMYDRHKWHLFPPSYETLPNFDYDLIFADSRNRIWFGTNQSSPNYGFTVYDGSTWSTFYSPGRYSISYLYEMAEDHFGNLWFATGGGLLKYDGTTWTIFDNENSGLRSNTVYGVAVDLWGNVWAGTTTGLCVYNPSGVKLGPYEYDSPVDSLSVNLSNGIVAATFIPRRGSHEPVSYHLERGRGAHKFWKVADVDAVPDDSSGVVLIDTSTIIGTYYYRIKEVASGGHARYSEWKQILGGSTGVTLIDLQSYTAEQVLRLRWFTEFEAFIARYEVLSRHPDSSAFVMIRSVPPSSSGNGSYDVEASSLTRDSKTEEYALHVVYLDSSRAELERITVEFSLPLQIDISSNYPNPFNASTTFNVDLPEPGMVSMKMYDILGRELSAKFDEFLPEGYNRVSVDLKSQSSGVYFYILKALGVTRTGRILLLK